MDLCASDVQKTAYSGSKACRHADLVPDGLAPGQSRSAWESNQTSAEYPRHMCLHQLLSESALRTPNARAVEFDDKFLTFGELEARSNQVAHFLQKRGVGPESLVGLCVERSLEMVVALLGILKAG